MGARNVAAAFARWGDLPHSQFRLLVGMAFTALDAPSKEGRPARVYFGGEEALVELLGRSRSQMYETLSGLKNAGAVDVLDSGRSRHRAVYKLNLDTLPTEGQGPEDPDANGSGTPGRKGSGKPGHTGSGRPGPLGTTKGSTRTSRTGETSSPEVPHQGRATTSNDDEFDYSTASQIVTAALGIERAAARIRELTADGTDYTAAMLTLAHEIGDAR